MSQVTETYTQNVLLVDNSPYLTGSYKSTQLLGGVERAFIDTPHSSGFSEHSLMFESHRKVPQNVISLDYSTYLTG